MPTATKQTLRSLGSKNHRLQPRAFTQLYKKLSEHTIRKLYSLVRTSINLRNNPEWRPANVRRTVSNAAPTKLAGKVGSRVLGEAKKLRKQLQREHDKKGKPA